MKKQAISLLLAFLFLVSLFPAIGGGQVRAAEEEQIPALEEAPAAEPQPDEPAEELTADEPVEGEQYLASSGTCGDNVTWTLSAAGTLTISGSGEMTSHPWCQWGRLSLVSMGTVLSDSIWRQRNGSFVFVFPIRRRRRRFAQAKGSLV